ncbi:regulator of (H+)-ATPase in vacuolar membrane [Phytophthora boehmeriae]|uniref:Regulator of (H+)-ATPase in vacuolar membrane n=1 Tax=Phytophthora boehmeriae TaxID=109152 RepID=A0A8T1WXT3_9STRA|nr:regulator of (H+)-ATPase in vacuolar membrane [Phytophthora boehmeriae]
MVSVLRTLYARATYFLSTYEEVVNADEEEDALEKDIASSLFTPQKLWKAFGEGPLEGLKRWYALIESHLRCEFDYSVKEVPCLCGLYGLDNAVFEEAAVANSNWKELENRGNTNEHDNTHDNKGTESDRGGEGWLVTAITQYRLDGLHSYRTLYQHKRRGLSDREEPRIPFLVEIYSRSQRNAMFQEAGLPHRFVGVITVELFEAKDLIACSWIGHWSDPYVFLELAHSGDKPRETAEEWSLQTYRSQVGEGGVNPRWKATENKFMFRFAIPTHDKHTSNASREVHFGNGGSSVGRSDVRAIRAAAQLWNADSTEQNRASMEALEKLLPSVFDGPPAMLQCTVYQKNKVLNHQLMGRAKVSLDSLTSGNPMDCWLQLEDTPSGSLHLRISLSFQLMCSSMGSTV